MFLRSSGSPSRLKSDPHELLVTVVLVQRGSRHFTFGVADEGDLSRSCQKAEPSRRDWYQLVGSVGSEFTRGSPHHFGAWNGPLPPGDYREPLPSVFSVRWLEGVETLDLTVVPYVTAYFFPISIAITLIVLVSGVVFFRTTERSFADVI